VQAYVFFLSLCVRDSYFNCVSAKSADGRTANAYGTVLTRGFFKDNVTGGDIRLKGRGRGSQGTLRGPDSPPITMQYVYTVELQNVNVTITSLRSCTVV